MHVSRILTIIITAATLTLAACSGRPAASAAAPSSAKATTQDVPQFDADSAYAFVNEQVAMGPRTPGSEAARRCAAWIEETLRLYGADTVIVQRTAVPDPMNPDRKVPLVNILGRYNPEAKARMMLVAHYDTRPIADEENDKAKATQPIPGANDGGSGVGVMLETARIISMKRPSAGVDLLFVDLEDSGTAGDDDSWCQGSQYFAANMPYSGIADTPQAAIVLDMVGAPGARFHREAFSQHFNRALNDKVWAAARTAGYATRFPDETGAPILDDHLPLIRAGIPAVDIVENNSDATGSFPAAWHTLADDMTNIDPATLKAVGQTVTQFIYSFR